MRNLGKKITDKYLGRITKDGLIPPKSKIKGEIVIKEYGIYAFILSLSSTIVNRVIKDHFSDYKTILTIALIKLIYNEFNNLHYHNSYMSIIYPDINISSINDEANVTIERLVRMFRSNISKHKIDLMELIIVFKTISIVKINDEWIISSLTSTASEIINKYNINLRGVLCQE